MNISLLNHPSYTFQNIIGQGGMATVYLAEHNTLHKSVAIKVLNKEFVHNENIRKRFLAEARNLFGMSHPYIIKVTDLIDQDNLVAFVMEYIEGQTLKDYLDKKGRLTDEEIKQIFIQMLDAVGYVHEQGFIHRDIKPSNFMISRKGVIKLLDFGISKNTDIKSAEYTMTGTFQNMGTPMYMSPEQVKSTKDVTLQSDIYSLGVVLWQMVKGCKPYDIENLSTFEVQTRIVNKLLPLTKTFWDSIIQKATSKDHETRFQDINTFINSISKLQITNSESVITKLNAPLNITSEETIVHSPKTEITKEKPIKSEKKIQIESEATKVETVHSNQINDSHEVGTKDKKSTKKETSDINISTERKGGKLIDQNFIYPQIFAYIGIFSLVMLFANEFKISLSALNNTSQSFIGFLDILTFIPAKVNSVLFLVAKLSVLISLRKYCQNFGQSGIKIPFTAVILYEIFLFANSQFSLITFMYMLGYYILEIIAVVLYLIIGIILIRVNVSDRYFKLSGFALIFNSIIGVIGLIYYSNNGLETQQISDTILLSFFGKATAIYYLFCIKNVFKNATAK